MPTALPTGSLVRADAPRLSRVALRLLSTRETEDGLKRIPWDAPCVSIAHLLAGVKAGEVYAVGTEQDGVLSGTFFGRVERRQGVRVFRILGAESSLAETWAVGLPLIETFARGLGCEWIHTDTSRPAVALAHASAAYQVSEIHLVKKL